jgi:hypothetical protein
MRSLKLLVIVLGILIIAAVATIMVTLVNRAGGGASSDKPWAQTLEVPAGATIQDYRLDGDRLVIRLSVPGKPDELRILDLSRGRQIGAVTLKSQ